MKTQKLFKLALIIVVVLFSTNLFSQVQFTVEVKNQTLVPADPTYGDCVYFEVWLTDNNGPGVIRIHYFLRTQISSSHLM